MPHCLSPADVTIVHTLRLPIMTLMYSGFECGIPGGNRNYMILISNNLISQIFAFYSTLPIYNTPISDTWAANE